MILWIIEFLICVEIEISHVYWSEQFSWSQHQSEEWGVVVTVQLSGEEEPVNILQ